MEPTSTGLEKHITAIGTISTLLTVLSSFFSNTFRGFGYILIALSSGLLLIVAVIRLNDSLRHKKHLILPLLLGIFLVCVTAMGLAGWSLVRTRSLDTGASSGKVGGPVQQQATPQNTTTLSTTGEKSPIITGSGNSVSITDSHEKSAVKKKSN